jgi:hypothetical protein
MLVATCRSGFSRDNALPAKAGPTGVYPFGLSVRGVVYICFVAVAFLHSLSKKVLEMKLCNKLKWATCAGVIVASGMAWAGPEVSVTFKNNTGDTAHYNAVGSNGIATQSNALPTPQATVAAAQTDSYRVRSSVSPDMGYAVVDYRVGSKTCRFSTTYTRNFTSGVRTPKWNKSAVAGGGARCDVKVTTVDYASHNWSVEFTMN